MAPRHTRSKSVSGTCPSLDGTPAEALSSPRSRSPGRAVGTANPKGGENQTLRDLEVALELPSPLQEVPRPPCCSHGAVTALSSARLELAINGARGR